MNGFSQHLGHASAKGVVPRVLRFAWLAMLLLLGTTTLSAQNFSFEGGTIAGGGGASSNASFSISGVMGEFHTGRSSGTGFAFDGGFWIPTPSAPGPVRPSLAVKRIGGTLEVSWASAGGAFLLQEASSLTGTSWSDSAAVPSLINGQWVVALGIPSASRFFRLASAPPVLSVKRTGTAVDVSWTSADDTFVLQETANLGGAASWSNVTTATSLINGRRVVTLPSTSGVRFLRLRRR